MDKVSQRRLRHLPPVRQNILFVPFFILVCNCRSLRGHSDVTCGVNHQSDVPKKLSKRKVDKKRKKSGAHFEIDGTPLEPLGDME